MERGGHNLWSSLLKVSPDRPDDFGRQLFNHDVQDKQSSSALPRGVVRLDMRERCAWMNGWSEREGPVERGGGEGWKLGEEAKRQNMSAEVQEMGEEKCWVFV